MPYKDPERKRQWEQEHREERNARRRKQPLTVPYPVYDPLSLRKPTAGWKLVAGIGGLALAVGMALLAVWRGASGPSTGP
jgi:hypothetical protein